MLCEMQMRLSCTFAVHQGDLGDEQRETGRNTGIWDSWVPRRLVLIIPHQPPWLLAPRLHIWLPVASYGHSNLVASMEAPCWPTRLSSLLDSCISLLGCHIKVLHTGWLKKEITFPPVLETSNLKLRCQQKPCSFPQLLVVSSSPCYSLAGAPPHQSMSSSTWPFSLCMCICMHVSFPLIIKIPVVLD